MVKRIYHLRAQGYSSTAICRELNERGIPSPSKLRYLRHQTKDETAKDALWNRATVRKILSDENYIGNRVHGKKKQDAPAAAKRRTTKDEWQIIENAHPAIISKEFFEQVQAMNEKEDGQFECTAAPAPQNTKANILKGKVFCGDCGKAMKAAKSGGGAAYYNCSSYKESGGARCSNHYISEGAVYAAITQEIEKMLADGFLSGHSTKIIADYEKQLANIDTDIHQLSVKKEELSNALLETYEACISHRIMKDDFKNQSERLSAEHTECEIKERTLIAEKGRCTEQIGKLNRLISALREYQASCTLTKELVEAFIERISIFPQQRIELVLVAPELAATLR